MPRSRLARFLWAALAVPALVLGPTSAPAAQEVVSPPLFVRTWGSWGTGAGQFVYPRGVAVSNTGAAVYVVDGENHRIQKFGPTGQLKLTWGGYGTAAGQFFSPSGVAVDSMGYVYVVDTWNNRIQKFTSAGVHVRSWGQYGRGPGQFRFPWGIAVDGSRRVYVTDSYNDRVQVFGPGGGNYVGSWGSLGSSAGQFDTPLGIAYSVAANRIYIADQMNDRVQSFTTSGGYVRSWGSLGSQTGRFDKPQWVAVDSRGSVYVTDGQNARVQQFSATGAFQTSWGTYGSGQGQFSWPQGIAVDREYRIHVVDQGNSRVQTFLPVIRRPDAMVWFGGSYVGDGTYNATGSGQSVSKDIKTVQGSAYFSVNAQNDGSVVDDLVMRHDGCSGDVDRFTVTYDLGGVDVTSQMTGGGLTFNLAPTQFTGVRARIKARWMTDPVDWVSCRVRVSSVGDPAMTDVVKIRVTQR